MNKRWVAGLILVSIITIIFLIIYFLPPVVNYRHLTNTVSEMTVYSESRGFSDCKYEMIDTYLKYNPKKICTYRCSFDILDVIDFYERDLISEGWSCVHDGFGEKRYYRVYSKNNVFVHLSYYTDGLIRIIASKGESSNSLGECKDVELRSPEPFVTDDGVIIHRGLDFKYKE